MSASVVLHKSMRTLLPALALAGAISAAEGSDWEKLPFSVYEPVHAVAALDSILIIGTENGIKRSADGGSTWTAAEPGQISGRVTAIARVGRRLVAGHRDKLLFSDDGGITWVPASGPDPYLTVVGFSTRNDSVFALLTLYPGTGPNLDAKFLSLDGGASWTDAGIWSGTVLYDPLPIGGDSLLAISQGRIELGLGSGTRWNPIPVDSGWGFFSSLAIQGGRLYATTAGGVLLRSLDTKAVFSSAPVDPSPQMRPFFLAASGERVCAFTKHHISCSEDEGATWRMTRNNFHVFESQLMAMGDRYLYIGKSFGWSGEGLWRFDIAAKTWSHLAWMEAGRDFQWHWNSGSLFTAYGKKAVLSKNLGQQSGWVTNAISENYGETWDSIPSWLSRYQKGALFLSKGWSGMILKSPVSPIRFSKDGEDAWDSLPGEFREGWPSDDFIRSQTQITASGSQLFVCGNKGELWKGDMEAKTWSLINTPGEMQVCQVGEASSLTYLAASDSALYASTPSGLWRLPLSEGTVAVTPSKGSTRHRSTKAVLTTPSPGSGKVLVTPAPSGRARPGTYDFNGIKQPEVQSGKGSP